MSNDAVLTDPPGVTAASQHPAAAERMRAHRARRREGLRCFMLEIRAREIDELIRRGLLPPDARNDAEAVKMALYEHLERTLRP